jgi:hypothetical protein
MPTARGLLEVLDRFLEAAGRSSRQRPKRRALAPIERKLERAMQRAFRAQGRAFAKRFAALKGLFPIEEAIGEWDWSPLFDDAELETLQLFVEPIEIAVAAALQAGAKANIASLGVALSFDLKNPRAVAYLDQYGAKRVSQVNQHTRDELRKIVTKAVAEGWSYDRTAKAIVAKYGQFAVGKPQAHVDSRAHLIAITEVGEAYEHGNMIVAEDLVATGLEMEKRWVSMGDDRVSDGCRENEREGWIPLGQAHKSGHQRPLRFPGCRCSEHVRRKGAEE